MKPSEAVLTLAQELADITFPEMRINRLLVYQVIILRFLLNNDLTVSKRD